MYTREREKVLTILTFIAAWKYSFELKNSIRLLWSGSSFFFVCVLVLILNFCDTKADCSKCDLCSFRYDSPKSSQPLYCFSENHSQKKNFFFP